MQHASHIDSRSRSDMLRHAHERMLTIGGTTLLQLDPPLPVRTPRGDAYAHILAQDGNDGEICWTVVMVLTGDILSFPSGAIHGFDIPQASPQPAAA